MEYLELLAQSLEEAEGKDDVRRDVALSLVTFAMAVTPRNTPEDIEDLRLMNDLVQRMADRDMKELTGS